MTEPAAAAEGRAPTSPSAAHLADPRALQILIAEHASLGAARALVYNEAFSRAAMFLTFLSASLVALGFIYQGGTTRSSDFLVIAVALLALDLMIGLVTLGRIWAASAEEFRLIQGMNRVRHAWLEMVPSLEPYFSTSRHDDMPGVLAIYGATRERPRIVETFHGLTTTGGTIGLIDAVLAASIAAAIVALAGGAPVTATLAGGATFVVSFAAITAMVFRSFAATGRDLDVRFPHPPLD